VPDTPYNRQQIRERLITDLQALRIPRLDRETGLCDKRPEIPLSELTSGRLERLLALLDRWITDVRAHAAEPETAEPEITKTHNVAHAKSSADQESSTSDS
jgi:hypothetical protein